MTPIDRRTSFKFMRVGAMACVAACATACAPHTPAAEVTRAMPVVETALDFATMVPGAFGYPMNPGATSAAHAMVVTDAPIATDVGLQILRQGGNAIDAAVATAFALAVVYPEAGNIGGGGFIVTHFANGTNAALDFREEAPGGATRDMFLNARGDVTDASVIGHRAAGVPGAVAGLWAAHKRFGVLPWKTLVQPAIALARDGFIVDNELEASIADAMPRLAKFPASAALFLPGGKAPAKGSRWSNTDLAVVLQRIADQGPDGFYRGETARLIALEMKRGGGLINEADLGKYEAKWRDPIQFDYRGRHVVSMPPASSGGATLALISNILEGYPIGAMGWHSAGELHIMAEAMRRAFADRNAFMGDPDFVKIPLARMTSPRYADSLRMTIDLFRATPSSAIRPGLVQKPEPSHTTHFSIVDEAGNAVAMSTTINDLYGSAVTVAGTGVVLNDEMDDFTSKVGVPNMYGLVQGDANAIAPGKRMLSAMTPTIVLDAKGSPLLITGARGGPHIITAVAQVMSNVIDYGMDIGNAVHAPRVHMQHLPDVLYFEPDGLSKSAVDRLTAMGYVLDGKSTYLGNAPAILRRNGVWTAVADPRSGGTARGY